MHGALHHHPLNTHPLNGDEFPSYIISGDLAADVLVGGVVDARVGVQGVAAATVWGVAPNVAGLGGVLAGSALNAAALHGNITEPRDNALLRGNAGIHGFFRVERGVDGGELVGNAGIHGHVVAPTVISGETAGRVGVQGSIHGSTVTGGLFSGKGGMTIQGDFAATSITLADFHGPAGIQGDFAATLRTPGGVEFAQTWGPLAGFSLHSHTLHGWQTRRRPVAKALFSGTAGNQGFFRTQLDTMSLDMTGDTWLELQFSAPGAQTTATCTGQLGTQGELSAGLDDQVASFQGDSWLELEFLAQLAGVTGLLELDSHLFAEFSTTLSPLTATCTGQLGTQGELSAGLDDQAGLLSGQLGIQGDVAGVSMSVAMDTVRSGPLGAVALNGLALGEGLPGRVIRPGAEFIAQVGIQGGMEAHVGPVALVMTGGSWLELQFSAPGAHTAATCTVQLGTQGELSAGLDDQAGLLSGQLGIQGDVAGASHPIAPPVAVSISSGALGAYPLSALPMAGGVPGTVNMPGAGFAGRVGVQGGLAVGMDYLVLEIAGQLGVNASVLAALSPNLLHLLGQLGIQGDVAGVLLILGLFTPLDIRVVRGESRFPFVQAGMSTMTFDRDVATIFPGVEIDDLPFYNPILDEAFIHAG